MTNFAHIKSIFATLQADSLYTIQSSGDTLTDTILVSEPMPSLFTASVDKESLAEKPIVVMHQPFWVPAILIFCFILLAWGRLFYRRRLEMVFRAVFAKNYANQLNREGNLFNERIGLILFLVYLLVISLFVYLAIPLFETGPISLAPGLTYLLILGFFTGLWFLKVFLVKVLSLLFNTNEHSRELLANMYLYNLFAGITILPVTACMAYAQLDIFFYIGLVIITITYLFRIVREAIIGFRIIKFSVFHLILYLCTLEILPLIILVKILMRDVIL